MSSITASNAGVPYTLPLQQDVNFNTSNSFPSASISGSTPSVYYANLQYPTTGKFVVQVYNTALTNTNNAAVISMSLEDSADNVTFAPIAVFSPTLLTATDSAGSAPAGNVQVQLAPTARPYLRVRASVPNSGSKAGGITGSYGLASLF